MSDKDEYTPQPEDTVEDLEARETEEVNEGAEENETEEVEDSNDDGRVYSKKDVDKAAKRRQAALDRARKAEAELAELRKSSATKEERLKIEAAEEANRVAENLYKPAIVRKHLFYEMASLGLTKEQIPDIVDLIKMQNIEIDDEFNVEGADEEIQRIKDRFPKLFQSEEAETAVKRNRANTRKLPKADGSPKPAPEAPKTARDKIIARMKGES